MICDRGADDVAVILLLLQAGNTNAHQHRIYLGIADSAGPGSGFRQRYTNAGLVFHGRETGNRRLGLCTRAKIPGDILKVHRAIGVTQRRAVEENPGRIQPTSKLTFAKGQQHAAARH
ncbi:hypothetical protein D3C75_562570 [compost metagenome]